MFFCKIMFNFVDDVNQFMISKQVQKYVGKFFEVMKVIVCVYFNCLLEEYECVLGIYKWELVSDGFVWNYLRRLYDVMFEQNFIKVIELFSWVEIDYIVKMVSLDKEQVERKLLQMILDKVIIGVLDQGVGCLIIYDEMYWDEVYDVVLVMIEKLSNVVDVFYINQVLFLEQVGFLRGKRWNCCNIIILGQGEEVFDRECIFRKRGVEIEN